VLSEQVRPLAISHQIEFAPPNSITAALGADQDCTQAAIELRCGNRYRIMLNRLTAKRKIFVAIIVQTKSANRACPAKTYERCAEFR
jgi:hypothetical protein